MENKSTNTSINEAVSEQAATMPELRDIPLDRIKVSRFWHRRDYEKNLDSLAFSVQKHGLLELPAVRDNGDGYYELIFGHRRYFSHKRMGRKNMLCCICKVDPQEAGVLSFVENNDRSDMHPVDKAITLKQIKDEKNLTDDQLAKEVGCKQNTITEYIGILRLGNDVLDKVDTRPESHFKFTHVVALSRLQNTNRVNRKIEVQQLQNKTINHKLSSTELKCLVKIFTDGKFERLPNTLRTYLLTSEAMTANMAELYLNPEDAISGRDEIAARQRKTAEELDRKQLEKLIAKAVKNEWGYETTRQKILDLIRRPSPSAADERNPTESVSENLFNDISALVTKLRPALNKIPEAVESNPGLLVGLCSALEQLQSQLSPLVTAMKDAITKNKIKVSG